MTLRTHRFETRRAGGTALLWALTLLAPAALAACPRPATSPTAADLNEAEALYLPTPQPVVQAMLELADVHAGDVVYDLGSGDGRIPITAARRYGVRAVGIELDGRKVAEARCDARENGVEQLVEFRQADIFDADFSDATVVTLFLFPEMVQRLRPRLLEELAPGTRIVSHRFDLRGWPPDRRIDVGGDTIYLWIVPARRMR